MSHAGQTLHYQLPQYEGTDIINPLVDTNDAYEKIDEAIYNVADAAATAVQTANEVKEDIEGTGGVDSRISALVTRMDAVETKNVEQDTSILGVQQAIQTTNGNVATNTQNIADVTATVQGHTTSIGNLTTRVQACENADTALDVRVTALENAPTPSMPTAADVSFDNTGMHLAATNVQDAIEELDAEGHNLVGELQTTTLTAGQTSATVTFANQQIGATTIITPVCGKYGVSPTDVTYTATTITLTFEAQTEDMLVGARVQNVI